MALVVKDRVQESSTTTGTGTLTFGGALTGFQTFSSAIGNGNTTYYAITLDGEWEVGIGTVGAGTLTRDTVLESSNSGSLVNFSVGTKNVFCTYPAEKSVDIDTAQTLSNKSFASFIPINGSTSGSVTLDAPAVAGSTVLTLPATSGTLNTSGAVNVVPAGSASAPAITTTGDTNTGMFFPAADTIAFTEGGVEAMRIDSSGNVLVGTTTPTSTSNAGASFQLESNSRATLFLGTLTTSFDRLTSFRNTNGQVGSIGVSGSTTTYGTSSDYRLKENVAPMVGALDKVALLKPVTYTWKVDGSDGQGFIAHELQEVVPECVSGEKDGVDSEGNPEYQGVDTSFLVATLTAAIQELKAELDVVKAELTALKGVA